jgi:hypothetical protein
MWAYLKIFLTVYQVLKSINDSLPKDSAKRLVDAYHKGLKEIRDKLKDM